MELLLVMAVSLLHAHVVSLVLHDCVHWQGHHSGHRVSAEEVKHIHSSFLFQHPTCAHNSSLEGATKLKSAPLCSSCGALSGDIFVCRR